LRCPRPTSTFYVTQLHDIQRRLLAPRQLLRTHDSLFHNMKPPAIDQLVYECMFPKPKATDPQSFQALLQRQLVPEVRLETQAFYGHLSSQEAKYPGLDYSYQPHRVRLSRYQWHRRLFRAFDNLGLTKSEIASLTKWEGTRWAKERFEREQGIVIRDTTSVSLYFSNSCVLREQRAQDISPDMSWPFNSCVLARFLLFFSTSTY
jgi:hypothetical protein